MVKETSSLMSICNSGRSEGNRIWNVGDASHRNNDEVVRSSRFVILCDSDTFLWSVTAIEKWPDATDLFSSKWCFLASVAFNKVSLPLYIIWEVS